MQRRGFDWWRRLRVQQKVWMILLGLFLSFAIALSVHVTVVNHLLDVQLKRQHTVMTREQLQILLRHMLEVEDTFRGYLLTQQDIYLRPFEEAESKIEPTFARTAELLRDTPGVEIDIPDLNDRLRAFLDSKRRLMELVRAGRTGEAMVYVQSGQGLAVSNALREEFRLIEGKLNAHLQQVGSNESVVSRQLLLGLLTAGAVILAFGFLGSRLLTASITQPLTQLHASVATLSERLEQKGRLGAIAIHSTDEIGQLARSYENMSERIRQQIRGLEAMNTIGHEIGTIGPDGLDEVLRRITNGATEPLQADVCLVMLRNDKMGCWVVEAASGGWNDRLHKSVMLWEEFPVSVRAFETGEPAIGEDLRSDQRPEVVRRNLIGQSMLSIPLRAQGVSFGVLVLLKERKVPPDYWNIRVARQFADSAAIAITNARLYEVVQQKGKGYETRLRQLEHLAEMLAHDLKAPGERMEGLASLLLADYGEQLDERAGRWLRLIEENGKELTDRVESILGLALVGGRHEALEAVDPAFVLKEVLKGRAEELACRRTQVHVYSMLPMVACHRAYLRQILDNLISNAIKFSEDRSDPHITIAGLRIGDRVHISVSDNGRGVPPQHQARVFEPFVRLHHGTEGSGIGLAIVKRIVELYDGSVWIEPKEPPGCTVTFTLPVLGDFSVVPPSVSGETGIAAKDRSTA